jgi:hypothetical protein
MPGEYLIAPATLQNATHTATPVYGQAMAPAYVTKLRSHDSPLRPGLSRSAASDTTQITVGTESIFWTEWKLRYAKNKLQLYDSHVSCLGTSLICWYLTGATIHLRCVARNSDH